jgi:hypothetical protein
MRCWQLYFESAQPGFATRTLGDVQLVLAPGQRRRARQRALPRPSRRGRRPSWWW